MFWDFRFRAEGSGIGDHGLGFPGLWLAGNEGMEMQTETIIMGYIGITIRIHSFIPR